MVPRGPDNLSTSWPAKMAAKLRRHPPVRRTSSAAAMRAACMVESALTFLRLLFAVSWMPMRPVPAPGEGEEEEATAPASPVDSGHTLCPSDAHGSESVVRMRVRVIREAGDCL